MCSLILLSPERPLGLRAFDPLSLRGPSNLVLIGERLLTWNLYFFLRVKTGYVTNKVVGVDGGLFPQ